MTDHESGPPHVGSSANGQKGTGGGHGALEARSSAVPGAYRPSSKGNFAANASSASDGSTVGGAR